MNCVVVGCGSIGKRHARILKQLNYRVAVVTHGHIKYEHTYKDLSAALEQEKPEYIVISNETSEHYNTLVQLGGYGFKGIVLVEKPLFHDTKQLQANNFKRAYVGYNLRFHPIIQRISEILMNEQALFCQVYVGQYLPYWRPERDYRLSYSASKEKGGGVLRDLSHELDYLRLLFGDWESMIALGGKYSALEIDSDDMFSLMLIMNKCPMVQVHLNYLDRFSRREITVITENSSLKADLVRQTLRINDSLIDFCVDRDYTYLAQHKAVINGEDSKLCGLEDGLNVLEMIKCAEQSAMQRKWVDR